MRRPVRPDSRAAVALSDLEADTLSVSPAFGQSKPSTTLNEYSQMASNRLELLMDRIDDLVSPRGTPDDAA